MDNRERQAMIAEYLETANYVQQTPWFRIYNILISVLVYSYFAVGLISGFWSLVGGYVAFMVLAIILTILYRLTARSTISQIFILLPSMLITYPINLITNLVLWPFKLDEYDHKTYSVGINITVLRSLLTVGLCYLLVPYIAKIFS